MKLYQNDFISIRNTHDQSILIHMKILVTGGTNGMGKGVVKTLATIDNQVHEIIILCRSQKLGDLLIKELKNTTKNTKSSLVICDLSRLSDVHKAIEEIHDKHEFLDCLFINAGLGYADKRIETIDGMDSHFQVNYLSQFMLTLNLLDLLEKSEIGAKVIFNATERGEIYWDDIQMKNNWNFEDAIHQAMVAKRMFYLKLHDLYSKMDNSNISFYGFQIHKPVWSNQLNIIPIFMKTMALIMRLFGGFITIEKCGMIMSPLFTEVQKASIKKSGKLITWKKDRFIEIKYDHLAFSKESQDKLWKTSLDLCRNKRTIQIAKKLTSNFF